MLLAMLELRHEGDSETTLCVFAAAGWRFRCPVSKWCTASSEELICRVCDVFVGPRGVDCGRPDEEQRVKEWAAWGLQGCCRVLNGLRGLKET